MSKKSEWIGVWKIQPRGNVRLGRFTSAHTDDEILDKIGLKKSEVIIHRAKGRGKKRCAKIENGSEKINLFFDEKSTA